jgi:hypothetical protein
MDSGDDPRSGKALISYLLQGTQNRLELLLVLACGPPRQLLSAAVTTH